MRYVDDPHTQEASPRGVSVAMVIARDLELSFEHDGHGGFQLVPFATRGDMHGYGIVVGEATTFTSADVRQLIDDLTAVAERMES